MSATPYDERHSIEVHVLAQQLKVNRSIGVAIEYEAPCVSMLCHMMRDVHCHHSVKSPHDGNDNSCHSAMPEPLPS
jgi:hypothetical protein